MYVWFEALLNYLTVSNTNNLNIKNMEMINIIGKDISKFHCYFWPLILQLSKMFPKNLTVLIHHHWLKKDLKMSKSIGNVIDPNQLIDEYGLDAVRFYFLGFGPQSHDVNVDITSIRDLYYKYIPNSLSILIK